MSKFGLNDCKGIKNGPKEAEEEREKEEKDLSIGILQKCWRRKKSNEEVLGLRHEHLKMAAESAAG